MRVIIKPAFHFATLHNSLSLRSFAKLVSANERNANHFPLDYLLSSETARKIPSCHAIWAAVECGMNNWSFSTFRAVIIHTRSTHESSNLKPGRIHYIYSPDPKSNPTFGAICLRMVSESPDRNASTSFEFSHGFAPAPFFHFNYN